jgi:hypothetical protein
MENMTPLFIRISTVPIIAITGPLLRTMVFISLPLILTTVPKHTFQQDYFADEKIKIQKG